MTSDKSFLATKQAKIYLISYLSVITIIFITPIVFSLIQHPNNFLYGMNVYFFELNLFASLVLFVYTYFSRYENKNWKIFLLYVILSLAYISISMIIIHFFI